MALPCTRITKGVTTVVFPSPPPLQDREIGTIKNRRWMGTHRGSMKKPMGSDQVLPCQTWLDNLYNNLVVPVGSKLEAYIDSIGSASCI